MKMPKPSEGGSYTPVPQGLHFAICYSVIDLGTQTIEWQGEKKEQRKVQISWEVPDERLETDQGNFPCTIQNRYTFSSHEKATLRQHLESWRGSAFTEEELNPENEEGFDIRNLLGVACQINVVHNSKGDKTYANITSIVPKPKGMDTPTTENKHIYFAMDEFDRNAFGSLPAYIQDVIKKSPEYNTNNGHNDRPDTHVNEMPDDEIPF